jgi:hypothetical protein
VVTPVGGSARPRFDGLAAVALSLTLALGLTLAPAAAGPVAAATGRLLTTAAATYTLDPAAGAVHVSVTVTFRNDKPSDASFFYYWRDMSWTVQPEATTIRVRDATGNLKVTPRAEDGYIDAQFRLRRDLLYGQTVKLTISWDLPGGEPRSDSAVRAGEAFAAFDLWAWGDAGASSVTARFPAGFEVDAFGSDVEIASTAGGVVVSAPAIADPAEFWASVTAIREASYASKELTLAGDISLRVRSWPEDTVWQTKVTTTLRLGLPELQWMIGLPWPVDKRLEVTEVYAPLLEGYAGVFYTVQQRIEISEDLDALTIVHEGAHAWFNDDLFDGRWISEGLADTYAAVALVGISGNGNTPDVPSASDPGHVALLAWQSPGRVTDETEAREFYGYNAAWYVMDQLYREVGRERMQAIFLAAHDSTIAYLGESVPEDVAPLDTWRRLLDLLEEIGGSTKAERLFRDWVVTPAAERELGPRTEARAAYAELVEAGDAWLPPIYVRSQMSQWSFPGAMERIEEASAILELRDEVAAAADVLELEPDGAFESAYESARDGLSAARAAGEAALGSLAVLAEASEALDSEPNVVATIGLLGETPAATYDDAAVAFESGRLDEAAALAAGALALIADAERVGGERLLAGGLGLGAVVLLVVSLVLLRRRSRRRAALAAPAVGDGPYATLAADPPTPPPDTAGEAGPDGGITDGDGPGATS